jgi:glycosyltransferase involved in cell wall biosynthesis
MSMRILHVIQELGMGGAERVVSALVRGAQASGHEVAVAAAAGSLDQEMDAYRYSLPLVERRPWRVPAAAFDLRRAYRATAPDVIHLHNPGMAVVSALAKVGMRQRPSLVTVHGVPDEDYRTAARLLRLIGAAVVACGPGVTAALATHGLPVTETIVNGVAPAPPPASRAELASELGFEADRPLILFVGRLSPIKNPSLPIAALARLPDAVLVVVGDGPLRGSLEEQARVTDVAERVVFAGTRTDARALIGAADAVVLTSASEGLPLVALESLAAGTPLVATAVRGIRELLHSDVDALLVPTGDEDALAQALRRVLSDQEVRTRLRASGLRTAALYSEEAMVAAYLDLYIRLRPKSSWPASLARATSGTG